MAKQAGAKAWGELGAQAKALKSPQWIQKEARLERMSIGSQWGVSDLAPILGKWPRKNVGKGWLLQESK